MSGGHDHDHHQGHHGHGARDDEHDDGPEIPLEENPLWQQDNVVLHSVGVDVGSSGTQVAFSRLHLRRLSEDLTSRYVVVRRETLFESEVYLTPYADGLRIDAAALGAMLDRAYADARIVPEDVDTGAVILTGEALRRVNAAAIAAVVSERAGDLVCASAGHHMEAMLAAYGSGAVLTSHRDGSRILNVDIGGGTTKLSLVEDGRIAATGAFHVGGRLIAVERDRVARIEPGGQRHAARAGHELAVGSPAPGAVLDDVAAAMARELLALLRDEPTDATASLWLTEPVEGLGSVDGVVFSGGVSEYVGGTEERDFGDLGRRLGGLIRAAIERGELPAPVVPAAERIRATVLGASEYTVQLSGITSYVGAPERTLPRRNVTVARPDYELGEVVDAASVGESIRRHVARFAEQLGPEDDLVLALSWDGRPEYPRLRSLAEAVVKGLDDRLAAGLPLYVILDGDVARTLGHILRDELGVASDLVILDGVLLRDFDYVDLGRVRQPSGTVPVTIKSLVFAAASSAADQGEPGE